MVIGKYCSCCKSYLIRSCCEVRPTDRESHRALIVDLQSLPKMYAGIGIIDIKISSLHRLCGRGLPQWVEYNPQVWQWCLVPIGSQQSTINPHIQYGCTSNLMTSRWLSAYQLKRTNTILRRESNPLIVRVDIPRLSSHTDHYSSVSTSHLCLFHHRWASMNRYLCDLLVCLFCDGQIAERQSNPIDSVSLGRLRHSYETATIAETACSYRLG
jgi:hypothetical protein